jgi:hypothetical protein
MVAIMSATKASLFGHPIHTAKLIVIYVAALAPIIFWFLSAKARSADSQRFVSTHYRISIVSMIVVLVILPFIDNYVNTALVSNRSYGSVLGNILFLFIGWLFWKLIAKRHNNRLVSDAGSNEVN